MSWPRWSPSVCWVRSASSWPGLPLVCWPSARPATCRTSCKRRTRMACPVPILLLQAVIVTILCLTFTVLPSVESAFQILSQISNIMFLTMYMVDVRRGHAPTLHPAEQTPPVPDSRRQFRHVDRRPHRPGGRSDRWRPQFHAAHADQHRQPGDLCRPPAGGYAVEVAIPFIIFAFRKPSWKATDSDFEPFAGQAKTRTPSQAS